MLGYSNLSDMEFLKVFTQNNVGRKPALLDNITQTLSAPLFVIVEVLFFFTMGDFKARVEPKIEKNVKAFHSKDNSKTAKAY